MDFSKELEIVLELFLSFYGWWLTGRGHKYSIHICCSTKYVLLYKCTKPIISVTLENYIGLKYLTLISDIFIFYAFWVWIWYVWVKGNLNMQYSNHYKSRIDTKSNIRPEDFCPSVLPSVLPSVTLMLPPGFWYGVGLESSGLRLISLNWKLR